MRPKHISASPVRVFFEESDFASGFCVGGQKSTLNLRLQATPLDATFTVERLRIQQDDCFSWPDGLSANDPMYWSKVRPHLEYATEIKAPTRRCDISQFATRLVRGLSHVPYEERVC